MQARPNRAVIDWRIFQILVALAVLVVGSNIAILIDYFSANEYHDRSFRFFVLDFENNLGSWFSCILLATTSLVLFRVASFVRAEGDQPSWPWNLLAAVFLLLSFDEYAAWHERLSALVSALKIKSEYLSIGWFLPVLGGCGVLFVGLLRFLRSLPRRELERFILAGAVFVTGAVVIESTSVRHWQSFGRDVGYYSAVTYEESLEVAGVLLFLGALLAFIYNRNGRSTQPTSWLVLARTLGKAGVVAVALSLPLILYVEARSFAFSEAFMSAKSLPSNGSTDFIVAKPLQKSGHGRWSSSDVATVRNMKPGSWVDFEVPIAEPGTYDVAAYLGKGPVGGHFRVSAGDKTVGAFDLCGRGKILVPTGPLQLGAVEAEPPMIRLRFELQSVDSKCRTHADLVVDGFQVVRSGQ